MPGGDGVLELAFTVFFEPSGRRLEGEEGETLIQLARRLSGGEGMASPCGGRGICGNCRVRVLEGSLSDPDEIEKELLGADDLRAGCRLACQAKVVAPVRVEIPPESLADRQRLQLEGPEVAVEPEPPVKRYFLELKGGSGGLPVSAWGQVEGALAEDYGLSGVRVDPELIRRTPALGGSRRAVVTVRGGEVINACFSGRAPKSLGLAVDLGTTKIAGFLVDLETGATIASEGMMNPQIACGEDVISRLAYALEGEGDYHRIAGLAADGLNRLLHSLAGRAGVDPEAVAEVVIAGNTAMHHLVLRLPVEQLARGPYMPASVDPVEIRGRELGLDTAPGAVVYLIPPIAGFVGGDHVAMILGSRIHQSDRVTLGIDIGTNTEIVLARGGEMVCCSCASGPAFEGAHIRHGMRAVDGAVSGLRLAEGGAGVFYQTINSMPPLGFCGSGILDAVAELYRHGAINRNGLLDRNHPRVRLSADEGIPGYLLFPSGESGTGGDLTITQKDIVEIQLAKAAIAGGIQLLLARTGLGQEDIQEVVVAGAFGTHLRLESAVAVGMLPPLPAGRFRQVGNAAGAGSRLALLSMGQRREAEKISRRVKYLELMGAPEFSSAFTKNLRFPGQLE